MPGLDLRALSRPQLVVVGASAVALISLFLPWYGASAAGLYSASVSGFSTGYGWLGGLFIIAAGAVLLAIRAGAKLPTLPVGPAVLVLGMSVVGVVLIALRWLTLPKGSGGIGGVATYSYGPRVGLYLTLIVGIVQAVAAFTLFKASGEQLPWGGRAATATPAPAGPAGESGLDPPTGDVN